MTLLLGACDPGPSAIGSNQPAKTTVASLVPAATDLILGMSAGSHLVAISNWDVKRPQTDALPRVGDYRDIDWEKIATLKPNLMIVQFAPDKMPVGLRERADAMHVGLVNVKINHLADVFATLDQLGNALDENAAAKDAHARLQSQLDAVKKSTEGEPRVRVLLTRSEASLAAVGGGNFLDEILTIAGGDNVLSGGDNSYPTIDREQLFKLDPEVVLVLLPDASTQVIEQAKQYWARMGDLRAVRNGRVRVLTQSYLLLPGYSVGKIAEDFASALQRGAP